MRGDRYTLHRGNVLDTYPDWKEPDLIVGDGDIAREPAPMMHRESGSYFHFLLGG